MRPDLVAGGSPCQDLSVAGNRAGLNGEQSRLFFEFARVVDALQPEWLLFENVPGLLSSHGGRDFGVVLGTLADLGYGLAWRILDSRFFGVPQRRRRVFVVGARIDGDPRAAAERAGDVLAVGTRCPRHPKTGGQARQDDPGEPVAGTLGGRRWFTGDDIDRGGLTSLIGLGNGGPDDNDAQARRLVVVEPVAAPLTSGGHPNSNAPGRRKEDDVNLVAFHPTGGGAKDLSPTDDLAPGTGTGTGGTVAVAYALNAKAGNRDDGESETFIPSEQAVRRLTPTECERLQGLPDGWTDVGDTTDSRRYSALGDAVTATVAHWLADRIRKATA